MTLMGELFNGGLEIVRQGALLVSAAAPERGTRLAWVELQNKLEAFQCFQRGRTLLDHSDGDRGAASRAGLAHAAALPAYPRLWCLEGMGYALGEGAFVASPGRLAGLPAAAILPLHTGMGLTLAAIAVERIAAGAPPVEALQGFVRRCQENAQPGCVGAAHEALGLAARTLRPERVPEIDRALAALDGILREFFWHGVGRGLYFVPSNLAPWDSAAERAAEHAQAEAPDELARRNALAGVAWAATLVNLRHPEILATALGGRALTAVPDALEHGAVAGVLVWMLANGRDGTLESFLGVGPCPADEQLMDRWRRWVVGPCSLALRDLAPLLIRSGRCGELFRVQPWSEVRRQLESEPVR